jgi:hypothetical protein
MGEFFVITHTENTKSLMISLLCGQGQPPHLTYQPIPVQVLTI